MKPITIDVQPPSQMPTRRIVRLDAEQLEAIIRAGYAAVTGKPLPEGRTFFWPRDRHAPRAYHPEDKLPLLEVCIDEETP